MKQVKKVAVLGTGMIGASLATLFAGNGISTVMIGRSMEKCRKAEQDVEKNLDSLIREGLIPASCRKPVLELLEFSDSMEVLRDVDFCYEAVFEDAEIKKAVYAAAEEFLPEDAVLASATSAIPVDILGADLVHKERFLVAHPWNPPHLVPLVEIVRSQYTGEEATVTAETFLQNCGRKTVVLRKSVEGFIGNRLQHAMLREALNLVEQGVCSAEDINEVILSGFGPRYSSIGLFEHYDCSGLPLNLQVQTKVFPTLCNADGPQKPLLEALKEGRLGMKTGSGILDWSSRDPEDFRDRQQRPYYRFVNWKTPEEA